MVRKEKWKMKKPEEENVPTQMLQLDQQGQPSPTRPLPEQPLGMGRPWSSAWKGTAAFPVPLPQSRGDAQAEARPLGTGTSCPGDGAWWDPT